MKKGEMGEKGKTRAPLATLAALALLALPFVVQQYAVSGVSMQPTFENGEVLLVENISPRLIGLSRGSIVVFRDPRHLEHPIIVKRVIGLPGEELTIGENNVTIMYQDGRAETFGANTIVGQGLEGARFFHIKLGSEDYFLMGDNRAESQDSRHWGTIQPHETIGRPVLRLWPLTRFALFPG